MWGKAEATPLQKELSRLQKTLSLWQGLNDQSAEAGLLLEMAQSEKCSQSCNEAGGEFLKILSQLELLEQQSMLGGEHDALNCYVSLNAGAGGVEACDWVAILMRMYLRYAEQNALKAQVLSVTEGGEGGVKSCTLEVAGDYAYGYLKGESGVHRLVRLSPFDASNRRHTSFAAVLVWPQVEAGVDVEILPKDLRIDTYKSSGAGGQHVNTTDSAVRVTHLPTKTVVQCQSERSQHANKDQALKLLKAALYEKELKKQEAAKEATREAQQINEWGSQIRSYVLHPYKMAKDHRTKFELGDVSRVLGGDLNLFVRSYLIWLRSRHV